MASSSGTKVTNDPAASSDPVNESSGAVTSDSLAAESTKGGGAFSENRNAGPLGVSSGSTTTNTTDTSGATKLEAAPDAERRQQREDASQPDSIKGPGGAKYAEAVGGQGNFSGQHSSEYGYAGGPTSAKSQTQQGSGSTGASSGQSTGGHQSGGSGRNSGGNSGGNGESKAGTAPGAYVQESVLDDLQGRKPKGANLKEGGFDSDDTNNASFNSEIGSKDDPGREAELKFQRQALESGPDAGGGPRQKGVSGDGQYDTLGSEEQA
ncbi:MAG: hypothetical protein M1833_001148 [Piccolia ochrophora]|nr:MAG: hypothetical protein M1833_001148 [Piccolia ochrophora]